MHPGFQSNVYQLLHLQQAGRGYCDNGQKP